jgi:hypothetical protein
MRNGQSQKPLNCTVLLLEVQNILSYPCWDAQIGHSHPKLELARSCVSALLKELRSSVRGSTGLPVTKPSGKSRTKPRAKNSSPRAWSQSQILIVQCAKHRNSHEMRPDCSGIFSVVTGSRPSEKS